MLRPVEWVGSNKADLKPCPRPGAPFKGLKGLGCSAPELVSRHDGDTFRAVHTVRFEIAVHVLYAFEEEGPAGHRHTAAGTRPGAPAPSGRRAALPCPPIVEADGMESSDIPVERSSGNVFAGLNLPDADAHLVKAELVSRIDDIVLARGITQTEAARLLGLSRLLHGDFREYSLERLFRLLTTHRPDHRDRHPAAALGLRRQAPHCRRRNRLTAPACPDHLLSVAGDGVPIRSNPPDLSRGIRAVRPGWRRHLESVWSRFPSGKPPLPFRGACPVSSGMKGSSRRRVPGTPPS